MDGGSQAGGSNICVVLHLLLIEIPLKYERKTCRWTFDVPVQIMLFLLFIQIWLYFYDLPTYLKMIRYNTRPIAINLYFMTLRKIKANIP